MSGGVTTMVPLFLLVEELADEVQPTDYIKPQVPSVPKGAKLLGPATTLMKQLYTVWAQHLNKKELGKTELIVRAAHTAFSYEVGNHFNRFGVHIGVTADWDVYSAQ